MATDESHRPYYGNTPPRWQVTAARGLDSDVVLDDLKGRWVLLEFWGYWCGPCVGRSLPYLIRFYEKHAADRDRFEIIAFHDASVKTFDELDRKLKPIVDRIWGGQTLPFPVLLDSTGHTIANFGINSFPTAVLINPEGRAVAGGSATIVEEIFNSRSGGF